MKKKEKSNYLWYIRNEKGVKGPFTIGMVQRFVLIGRLKQDDEVSQDKEQWLAVKDVNDIIPEEMRDMHSEDDEQRLLIAQLREDDRSSERRNAELSEFQGRRRPNERRQVEDFNTRIHRDIKNKTITNYLADKKLLVPTTLSILLFVGLIILGLFIYIESGKQVVQSPDCNSYPAPGVNWNHCQMEGVQLPGKQLQGAHFNNANLTAANMSGVNLAKADLAYANLSLSILRDANLQGATMKGTNLRSADLRNAKFIAVDLSYADLRNAKVDGAVFTDAILYKTIWIDGSQCLSEARGGCIEKHSPASTNKTADSP